jgi:hypothetical protein
MRERAFVGDATGGGEKESVATAVGVEIEGFGGVEALVEM